MIIQLIIEHMAGTPSLMEFRVNRDIPEPRWFDKIDTLTGTQEADAFFVGPPEFATQRYLDEFFVPMGKRSIGSADSELDILVYQEQERANYLEGFQAPTAHSYTYIVDFEPIEDEIIVGGNPYVMEIGDNDISMFAPARTKHW